MRVGVIGINHKAAGLKLREQLALAAQSLMEWAPFQEGEHTLVPLSTCNRTEIYFSSDDLATTHRYLLSKFRSLICGEFEQKLYAFFGYDCFLHLACVTSGLDSAITGETEIQGQVKLAYERTKKENSLPSDLHYLFQKSLRIGKVIRRSVNLRQGKPNLEHAVYSFGQKSFSQKDPSILFIGASEINLRIARFLTLKGHQNITLCNRSSERQQLFTKATDAHLLPWQNLHLWPTFDWVILATKSPSYLIGSSVIQDMRPELILDLAVPRNADPSLTKQGIALFNIDQINEHLFLGQETLQKEIRQAEGMIRHLAMQYVLLFRQKKNRHPFYVLPSVEHVESTAFNINSLCN